MALKDIFKISRKTFIDPSSWLGYDSLRTNTRGVWDAAKDVFVKPTPGQPETFAQAIKRLKLNSEDIQSLEKSYFLFAMSFLIISVFILVVSLFFLLTGAFLAFLLGISVTVLGLSQAFRFHFLYFQIKSKKLGCTFKEWKAATFNSGLKL